MNYWAVLGIVVFLYLMIDLLIYVRSKSVYIVRRSPWLIHLSLWGNLLEVISILPLMPYAIDSVYLPPLLLSLRDCGIILGHCLFFFPYILRSYRLYIVFNLEKNWDKDGATFTRRIPRTRQCWQIKILIFLLILPVLMCTLLLVYQSVQDYFPFTSKNTGKTDTDIATGIYIAVTFLEQLILIVLSFMLRHIEDQYKMSNELIWVCLIWSISPIFSTFIETDKIVWFSSCLLRNFLVLIRSDVVPLVLSLKQTPFAEALTVDMLNSLEIILETETTLEFFERFLKNEFGASGSESGYSLLCMFKEIECRLNVCGDEEMSFSESDRSKLSAVSSFDRIERKSSPEWLRKKKQAVLKVLNEKFYQSFLRSEECKELRRIIHRKEVIAYRVMQTSFIPANAMGKAGGNIYSVIK